MTCNSTSTRKKLFVGVLFVLLIGLFYGLFYKVEHKADYPSYPNLINHEGKIHPSLIAIAKAFCPDDAPQENANAKEWNAFLQKNFLRPEAQDHQEAQKAGQHPKHLELLPHFKSLRLIDEIMPNQQEFDVIVIFGGSPWDTEERFRWVNVLVAERGIKTKAFIYINGKRQLKSSELDWLKAKKLENITYQHEAAKALWGSFDLKKNPLTILTVAPPPGRRANTNDTLHAFLKYAKENDIHTVLFITNGPYGPYQFDTASMVIKGNLQFEGSSSPSNDNISTVSLTDTLARRFYTIVQNHSEFK